MANNSLPKFLSNYFSHKNKNSFRTSVTYAIDERSTRLFDKYRQRLTPLPCQKIPIEHSRKRLKVETYLNTMGNNRRVRRFVLKTTFVATSTERFEVTKQKSTYVYNL